MGALWPLREVTTLFVWGEGREEMLNECGLNEIIIKLIMITISISYQYKYPSRRG